MNNNHKKVQIKINLFYASKRKFIAIFLQEIKIIFFYKKRRLVALSVAAAALRLRETG